MMNRVFHTVVVLFAVEGEKWLLRRRHPSIGFPS
jgi:hypothetical protein